METYILVAKNLKAIPKNFKDQVREKIKDFDTTKNIVVDIFADGTILVFEHDKLILNFVETSTYSLPPLVGFDKKKKLRIWKTWTLDGTVYKSYGELGGKLITAKRGYKGVNKGRSNETSAAEQAKREAERDWVKQLDKLYFPIDQEGEEMIKKVRLEKGAQGGTNANVAATIRGQKKNESKKTKETDNGLVAGFESSILPMHCQPWSEEAKVLKYFDFDGGIYIQPKLDGVRCLAQNTSNGVILLSRHGKQQLWLKHIRTELAKIFYHFPNIILDGEMYADTINGIAVLEKKKYTYLPSKDHELDADQRFDVISGAVRPVRSTPHVLESELSYYVFDIADPTGKQDQDQRFEILKKIFASPIVKKECPHIKLVETKTCDFLEEVVELHDEYALRGFEGVVLRARDLCYESNKRSLRMRKYKYFQEEEFPIVDIQLDSGTSTEQFCWVCETVVNDETKQFRVKPMGTTEKKLEQYENSDSYIGKPLTVKYQRLSHDGIPLFPVGKSVRDYE